MKCYRLCNIYIIKYFLQILRGAFLNTLSQMLFYYFCIDFILPESVTSVDLELILFFAKDLSFLEPIKYFTKAVIVFRWRVRYVIA